MIHLLRLLRFPNLLIIIATQSIMRWLIIKPILSVSSFELQLSNLNFAILVLATVCLTAAGYVINDYFDTKTDLLNRPKKVVVGKHISRRKVMALHIILNIIGIVAGFYVSLQIGLFKLGIIYMIIAGILWYYSTTYKRQFLIGNIIVAFLTALVPLLVALYEIPLLNKEYGEFMLKNHSNFNSIFGWVGGFSFFAFITTLIRELIKDLEDFEGDNAYGRNTLPVILGITATKTIISILIGFTFISLLWVYVKYLKGNTPTLLYFIFALALPLLLMFVVNFRANKKRDFKLASLICKLIMLSGLLYSLLVYYIFTNILGSS